MSKNNFSSSFGKNYHFRELYSDFEMNNLWIWNEFFFCRVVKTGFYVSRRTLEKLFSLEKLFFWEKCKINRLLFSRTLNRIFSNLEREFLPRFPKLHSVCPEVLWLKNIFKHDYFNSELANHLRKKSLHTEELTFLSWYNTTKNIRSHSSAAILSIEGASEMAQK